MLILDEAEVAARLRPRALLPVLENALRALSEGRASAPARIAARAPAGLLAAMPGWVDGVLGCKLVSVFPENENHGRRGHQALIALFDAEHGEPVALLAGTAITAMRTGLVSALATRCLAPPAARVLAVLGTGVQARSHLRALPLVRRFAEIRVAGRNPARTAALAEECGASAADDFEAAVRGADVVCCCTHAAEPILRREWLAPGAHINSVGIGGRELDAETLAAATIVAVESPATFAPFPAGAYELQGMDPARGTELGLLLARATPPPPHTLTVFKSVGHAVEDVAVAAWVWRATPH